MVTLGPSEIVRPDQPTGQCIGVCHASDDVELASKVWIPARWLWDAGGSRLEAAEESYLGQVRSCRVGNLQVAPFVDCVDGSYRKAGL